MEGASHFVPTVEYEPTARYHAKMDQIARSAYRMAMEPGIKCTLQSEVKSGRHDRSADWNKDGGPPAGVSLLLRSS